MNYSRKRERIIAAAQRQALQISSLDELERWLNNGDFILALARLKSPKAKSTLGNFRFSNYYAHDCSNSHSAPHGKPTNWPRADGLPKSYPGISCRISFTGKIIHNSGHDSWIVSDTLKEIGIYTGTGGSSGNDIYTYDCTIWAEHFPKLFEYELAKSVGVKLGIPASSFRVEAA